MISQKHLMTLNLYVKWMRFQWWHDEWNFSTSKPIKGCILVFHDKNCEHSWLSDEILWLKIDPQHENCWKCLPIQNMTGSPWLSAVASFMLLRHPQQARVCSYKNAKNTEKIWITLMNLPKIAENRRHLELRLRNCLSNSCPPWLYPQNWETSNLVTIWWGNFFPSKPSRNRSWHNDFSLESTLSG